MNCANLQTARGQHCNALRDSPEGTGAGEGGIRQSSTSCAFLMRVFGLQEQNQMLQIFCIW